MNWPLARLFQTGDSDELMYCGSINSKTIPLWSNLVGAAIINMEDG